MGILVSALATAACNDKPHEEPSHALPPIEEHAAAPQAHAVHDPVDPLEGAAPDPHAGVDPHAGQEPHAAMAAMPAPGANPHVAQGADPKDPQDPMTPGDIAFDKATVIAGTLKLDGKTRDKVKPGDTIFVVVRGAPQGDTQGPVLAVRRLDAATFPMPFQIDSRDAMVAGTALKAPVTLTVRVDKDGDAITKNPGDVVGTATLKALPAQRLALTLDTVL